MNIVVFSAIFSRILHYNFCIARCHSESKQIQMTNVRCHVLHFFLPSCHFDFWPFGHIFVRFGPMVVSALKLIKNEKCIERIWALSVWQQRINMHERIEKCNWKERENNLHERCHARWGQRYGKNEEQYTAKNKLSFASPSIHICHQYFNYIFVIKNASKNSRKKHFERFFFVFEVGPSLSFFLCLFSTVKYQWTFLFFFLDEMKLKTKIKLNEATRFRFFGHSFRFALRQIRLETTQKVLSIFMFPKSKTSTNLPRWWLTSTTSTFQQNAICFQHRIKL